MMTDELPTDVPDPADVSIGALQASLFRLMTLYSVMPCLGKARTIVRLLSALIQHPDLKDTPTQQEIYHNAHFTYSTDLTALQAVTSDGVTVTVNEGTNTGWAATAVHPGIPSEQCGIYHGTAAASGGDPAPVPSRVSCSF